jgi:hypothetical protein
VVSTTVPTWNLLSPWISLTRYNLSHAFFWLFLIHFVTRMTHDHGTRAPLSHWIYPRQLMKCIQALLIFLFFYFLFYFLLIPFYFKNS